MAIPKEPKKSSKGEAWKKALVETEKRIRQEIVFNFDPMKSDGGRFGEMDYCEYNLNKYHLHFWEHTEDLTSKYGFFRKCAICRAIHGINYHKARRRLKTECANGNPMSDIESNADKLLKILDSFPERIDVGETVTFSYDNAMRHKLKIEIKSDGISYTILDKNDNCMEGTFMDMKNYKRMAKALFNFLYSKEK